MNAGRFGLFPAVPNERRSASSAGYAMLAVKPNEATAADAPTMVATPGLLFSLVFRAEPGKEDIILTMASAYESDCCDAVRQPTKVNPCCD